MIRHQSNESFLRKVLYANALFSAASGLACALFAAAVAHLLFAGQFTLMGLSEHALTLEVGLVLLAFAVFVFLAARQRLLKPGLVKAVILLDALWVAQSALLLVFLSDYFSAAGVAIVLATAVVTLLFAIDQILGLAMLYQGESDVEVAIDGPRMTITASLDTDADGERAWQVISDQEAYADVADNLTKVEVLDGAGPGMVRQCTDTGGRSWRETCTLWDDGRAFAFRVHTEAEDYPYPIAELSGTWSLAPTSNGTRITMEFEVQSKPGIVNRMLFRIMAAPFAMICDRLLQKWVRVMERRPAATLQDPVRPTHRPQPA